MSQDSTLVLLQQGIAAAKAGDSFRARQALQRVTELAPDNELGWLWRASVASSPQETLTCLERVLEINPANAQALKGLEWAKARIGNGHPSSRCPLCESALTQTHRCDRCHALLTLANAEALLEPNAVDTQLVHAAVARYQANLSRTNGDFGAHYNLGLAFLNLRKFDQGIEHLQKAAALHPDDNELTGQVELFIRLRKGPSIQMEPTRLPAVLVVDDSATVRKLVAITLEKNGYRVIAASDGLEGLAKISETQPDLILLDITMPRMDGYQLCKIIRANPSIQNVPIVMLSGRDGFFDKVRGRMAGSTDYITKPFKPDTLLQTVHKYVARETRSAGPA